MSELRGVVLSASKQCLMLLRHQVRCLVASCLVPVSQNVMESVLKKSYVVKWSLKLNKFLVEAHQLIVQTYNDSVLDWTST